jgi:hypothetical protein
VRAAAQRLAKNPDPASGLLAAATTDEKWLVRASAVSAIAARGDRALVSAVVRSMKNETVRFNAAAAIVRLKAGRLGRSVPEAGLGPDHCHRAQQKGRTRSLGSALWRRRCGHKLNFTATGLRCRSALKPPSS